MQLRNRGRVVSSTAIVKSPLKSPRNSARKRTRSSRDDIRSPKTPQVVQTNSSKRIRLSVGSTIDQRGLIQVVDAQSKKKGKNQTRSKGSGKRLTPKNPQKGKSLQKSAKKLQQKLFAKNPDNVVNVITSAVKKVAQCGKVGTSRTPSPPPPPATQTGSETGNDDLQCSTSSEENEEIVSFSPHEESQTQFQSQPAPAQSTSPVNYVAAQFEDYFDPYYFIKHIPPIDEAQRNRQAVLPCKTRQSPDYTLVLDLDETLVHCSLSPIPDHEFTFPINFQDVEYEVFVKTRPHFKEFLQEMASLFEIIIFTASKKVYADKLITIIDPEKKLVRHRLFREHCICVQGNYVKDLSILGRDLSKTIIVDNSPQAFAYHLENGIPIESWYKDPNDRELNKLETYLKGLATQKLDDLRIELSDKYKLRNRLPN